MRLQYDDRLKIEQMLKENYTVSEIADRIGYNRSSIYRELQRGGMPYSALQAQRAKGKKRNG